MDWLFNGNVGLTVKSAATELTFNTLVTTASYMESLSGSPAPLAA